MSDLVLLVADKNMHFTLKGALTRHESLQIRPVDFTFRVHMGRDGGVRVSGVEALALESERFQHAFLVLDYEGAGAGCKTSEELEAELDAKLQARWGNRAKAIVIEPELDVWIWGSSNALEEVFEWPLTIGIRQWLQERGFEFNSLGKPLRPKEALEQLISVHRKPRSSALYEKIAAKISLRNCQDAAFKRLSENLRKWFPIS